jgi:CheY-like chemotaxis protein
MERERQRILIVDDDVDFRDSLKVVFEHAGYNMLTAASRSEGMEEIRAERWWRSVKYEEVARKDYGAVDEARQGLAGYFGFCNTARPHQALGCRAPREAHLGLPADPSAGKIVTPWAGSEAEKVTGNNNVTGRNKNEKEAKRKKMRLLQNFTLRT